MAVLIPLVVVFTSNTLDLTDTQVSRARALAIAEEAIAQVERDLKTARSCWSSLLDSPVISIGDDHLAFVADLTGDGQSSLVRYQLEEENGETRLLRITSSTPDGDEAGVGDADGTVSEVERCSWTVEANQESELLASFTGEASEGDPWFEALHPTDGWVTTRQCRGLTEDFSQCEFSSVLVRITQKPLDPDAPDLTITREMPLDARWGRG